jgi:hypothetical protein
MHISYAMLMLVNLNIHSSTVAAITRIVGHQQDEHACTDDVWHLYYYGIVSHVQAQHSGTTDNGCTDTMQQTHDTYIVKLERCTQLTND